MSTFVIIDTNVIVAGLLTAHDDSPVARMLDGMLSAAFPFVVSVTGDKRLLQDEAMQARVILPQTFTASLQH